MKKKQQFLKIENRMKQMRSYASLRTQGHTEVTADHLKCSHCFKSFIYYLYVPGGASEFICIMCARCLQRPEDIRSPEKGVVGSF